MVSKQQTIGVYMDGRQPAGKFDEIQYNIPGNPLLRRISSIHQQQMTRHERGIIRSEE